MSDGSIFVPIKLPLRLPQSNRLLNHLHFEYDDEMQEEEKVHVLCRELVEQGISIDEYGKQQVDILDSDQEEVKEDGDILEEEEEGIDEDEDEDEFVQEEDEEQDEVVGEEDEEDEEQDEIVEEEYEKQEQYENQPRVYVRKEDEDELYAKFGFRVPSKRSLPQSQPTPKRRRRKKNEAAQLRASTKYAPWTDSKDAHLATGRREMDSTVPNAALGIYRRRAPVRQASWQLHTRGYFTTQLKIARVQQTGEGRS